LRRGGNGTSQKSSVSGEQGLSQDLKVTRPNLNPKNMIAKLTKKSRRNDEVCTSGSMTFASGSMIFALLLVHFRIRDVTFGFPMHFTGRKLTYTMR
jgi:hypothetical protein